MTKDLEVFYDKLKDSSDPDTNENMSLITSLQNRIISKNTEINDKKRKINGMSFYLYIKNWNLNLFYFIRFLNSRISSEE